MQVILIMDYLNNNKNKSSFTKLKFLKKSLHIYEKVMEIFPVLLNEVCAI